jgi:hypothetical protein
MSREVRVKDNEECVSGREGVVESVAGKRNPLFKYPFALFVVYIVIAHSQKIGDAYGR